MSRRLALLVVLALTSVAHSSEVGLGVGQTDHEAVAAAHDRWFAGILGRYDVLADLLAPDVTLRFPGGNQMPRSEFLGLLEAKQLFYDSANHHEKEIRVYGDAAVVTGKSTLRYRLRGNAGSELLAYTAVYVRANAKWSLVAWQSTRQSTARQ